MKCTLCRTAEAEFHRTTCPKCSAELPERLSPPLLAALSANAYRAIGGNDAERQRRKAALTVRCPFCKASPGSDCKKASYRGVVRTAPHPSRFEAATGSKAA